MMILRLIVLALAVVMMRVTPDLAWAVLVAALSYLFNRLVQGQLHEGAPSGLGHDAMSWKLPASWQRRRRSPARRARPLAPALLLKMKDTGQGKQN